MITSDQIVADILQREAGLENSPLDHGGLTNWGITLPTLRQLRPGATPDDLRGLSRDEAADIYRRLYVRPFDTAAAGDDAFLALLADSAVQHGVSRVHGWVEAGANTYSKLLSQRIQFYGSIVVHDPSQLAFLQGWLRRVCQFVR